ncbi:MAG: prolipoprotein diacylglyceryl transferase [Candidatus Dojkabacteria bacterium]|nr:prolipoprotein diacylglyceryl transferase [Candidatus Dojkabacteria bacterium]
MILIGTIKIYPYLFFLVLNALLVGFVLWRYRKTLGMSRERVFDFVFIYIAASIIFGRLIFVIQNWPDFGKLSWSLSPFYYLPGVERIWFKQMPFALMKFWDQGVDHSGMIYGGVVVTFVYYITKRFGTKNLWHVIKGLCLGQILQLLGYLYEGVYYGKETTLFIGIKYPNVDDLMRFPVQILEIFVLLALLAILPSLRKRDKSLGVGVYLFIFGWLGIFSFFLRDNVHSEIGVMQILYLIMVFIGIFIAVFALQKTKPIPMVSEGAALGQSFPREMRVQLADRHEVVRTYQESYSSYRKPKGKIFSRLKRWLARKNKY